MLGKARINIYMQCPGCVRDFQQAAREYWYHGNGCRGILQLDEYANVVCSACGAHGHLTKMRIGCNSGRHVMYTPGVDEAAASLACSAAFVDNMGLAWLQSVIEYLSM